jgi:hypothetical protein
MQALIDFDGWRKWKDAAVQNGLKDASTSDLKVGSMRRKKANIALQKAQKEKEAQEQAEAARSTLTPTLEKESSEETVRATGL